MKKAGYILMLTILGISVAVSLITVVVQQALSYQQQVRISIDRAEARLLVFSSLDMALSQLSLVLPKEEKKSEKKAELEAYQKWLLKILPKLNRWQSYQLTQDLEGSIDLFLASEQGKFNLSSFEAELQGLKQQAVKKDQPAKQPSAAKPPAKEPNDKKKQEAPELAKGSSLAAVDELLKKEKAIGLKEVLKRFHGQMRRMPEDPTELLNIDRFKEFKGQLFVTPEETKKIALTDLLTVRHGEKMNPVLLTRSVQNLLGLKDGLATITEETVKKIKPKVQWAQEWDTILADVYGKKFASLPEGIPPLFGDEFGVTAFSVVSYCTVGTVTQKVYAVLELTEPGPEQSPKSLIYKVGKLYWL